MKTNVSLRATLAALLFVAGWLASVRDLPAQPAREKPPLPYRFLVVINDQWQDPSSEFIDNACELSMLCTLLKSWGLPFDLYRLDQQRFDAYHLLDRAGRPLHGTIIWNAPGAKLDSEAAALLRTLVHQHGVGLVAFSDSVNTPAVAELAGVSVAGSYKSGDALAFPGEHFITRGLNAQEPPPIAVSKLLRNKWTITAAATAVGGVEVKAPAASVVTRRGEHPFLTAREIAGGGRVVWLDAERTTAQIYKQSMRDLFKRTLVWVNGYALYAEYPRSVLLAMDDMGASDKTFYSGWHYPSLTEEQIRVGLIEPLQRRKAVLTENVVTGFVDRRTRRVLNPWELQHVVDELDPAIIHDFASTKRGLDAGVKAGVLEIQCHGWTHLLPDLESAPGPFWSAPANSAVVKLNWYKEFGDVIRKIEVPAIVQRLHLQRALDCIETDFGVRPISLLCGGGTSSHSAVNNTMRIAAKLGIGIGQVEAACYYGRDLCFLLEPVSPRLEWNYTERLPAAAVPWTIDAPCWIGAHDRDVSVDLHSYERLLDDLGPGVRYMSYAEYCAYLHTEVDRNPAAGNAPALRLRYDEHYCRFFGTHASTWVLHLSDDARSALPHAAPERQTVSISPGLGTHAVNP
jgi:hypothetical protein